MSLNYLATRFTCSWPWSTMVLLCDGRLVCGCADPVRQACPRGCAAGKRDRGLDRRPRLVSARGSQHRRIEVLRRLRPQAAAQERRGVATARRSTWHRCLRGSTSSARRPVTSRAPRRAARRRPASRAPARRACWTSICSAAWSTRPVRHSCASISSTTARRSCTSARSRCASTSSAAFRTSISTRARTGWRSPRSRSRRLVRSGIDEVTFSIDGATPESYATYRQRGRFREGHPQPAVRGRREARAGARRAVPQLALHPLHAQRQRRRDGAGARDGRRDRRRSPVLGNDRSPRGHVFAALPAGHARAGGHQATRSGTTTTSATPSRAQRRAREIEVRRTGSGGRARPDPNLPMIARPGRPVRIAAHASGISRRGRSPRRPATDGGWFDSAPSSAIAIGTVINRDFERAWLPGTLQPGRVGAGADRRSPRRPQPGATR